MMAHENNNYQMFPFFDLEKHYQDCIFLNLMDMVSNNVLNCLEMLLMYAKTTWLSTQNLSFKPSICNSFLNKHASLTDKTTAVNSSLGI